MQPRRSQPRLLGPVAFLGALLLCHASPGADWWAFQPIVKPPVPSAAGDDWSRTPVDRFVLRRLREAGLEPAPRADRPTLLRRLFLDVAGLPPSAAAIRAFVDDPAPDAWEVLVDRLMADPRHGEHGARSWLDLVRYSESDGWNQDAYRPHVWRYRDWVVDAVNSDMPYPRFVREQLSGDEIPGDSPDQLVAAGFLRLGIYEYNQRDARGQWDDILNELTDVVGDVFLGISMGCARCHDHKFDPIPQRDYFELRAFFEPLCWRDDLPAATAAQRDEHARGMSEWRDATRDVRARIDALVKPYHDRKWKSTVDKFPLDVQACFRLPVSERTSRDHQMAYLVSRQFLEEGGGPLKSMKKEDRKRLDELEKELAAFDALRPPALPAMMTVTDFAGPSSPTVIPGDATPIAPGFLDALAGVAPPPAPSVRAESTGRRARLAAWIGAADNPLTTRVIVNRIWQQHFGEGLVSTPSNFGRTGQKPSHPELLDWLTATFIEGGWSIKRLRRLILTSAVWQQSARHPRAADQERRDPAERLLWRARVRRLGAEQIRDAMFAASSELDPRIGGPGVEEKSPRRALYVKRFRNRTETFLHVFDACAGLKSVAARNVTTTPVQSLLLFNGRYSLERARRFAARLLDTEGRPRDILRRACTLAWGREPTAVEVESALDFVTAAPAGGAVSSALASERLEDYCHILLNSSEFLYVE